MTLPADRPDLRVLRPRWWPREAVDFFEERAGILEHDARLPRDEAERQAREMTAAWWDKLDAATRHPAGNRSGCLAVDSDGCSQGVDGHDGSSSAQLAPRAPHDRVTS